MWPISWIAEQRERQILGYARPHLEEDEDVIHWTRGRNPQGKQEGFVYLTSRRTLVHWTGRGGDTRQLCWPEVGSWGVSTEDKGGPILALEGDGEVVVVQLVVKTSGMAGRVSEFLRKFAELVPEPRWPRPRTSLGAKLRADPEARVDFHTPSLAARTKRIAVTVAGIALVIVGLVLMTLPGPGLLVVIAGLGLLATEYDWAKDALVWARQKYRETAAKLRARRSAD